MIAPRAPGVARLIKFFDEFVAEQFHAHGGDFAEFNRRAAVGVEVLAARGQGVKGVAGFVQDGFDVALNADGVHENERQARFGQSGLIAARGLAFAIVQIEQTQIAHQSEFRGQFGIELGKNFPRCWKSDCSMRSKGRRAGRFSGSTARSHGRNARQAKLLAPLGLQFAQNRHDFLGDGFMEFPAILRRVIKAPARAEGVLEIIGETGVGGDLLAQLQELLENLLDGFRLPQTPAGPPIPTPPGARRGPGPPDSGPFAPGSVPPRETAR